METSDFERYVLPNLGSAYSFARWLVDDETIVESVIQEAMLCTFRFHKGRVPDGKAWVLRNVRNAAYAAIEAQRSISAPVQENTEEIDHHGEPDSDAGTPERAKSNPGDLELRVLQIPAELRECLVLREQERLSYREIVEVIGMGTSVVMSRLWQARRDYAPTIAQSCHNMHLLIQAYLDDELDVPNIAALTAHLRGCSVCADAQLEITRFSLRIKEELPRHAPPPSLRSTVIGLMRPAKQARPLREVPVSPLLSFGAGAALAATVALVMMPAQPPGGLIPDLVAAHIRALQPGHLVDTDLNDQDKVKPWSDGHLDYEPPVKDFSNQGFLLIGGRLDYVAGRPVSVLVYRRGRHLIDVFVWPGGPETGSGEAHGYNVVSGVAGGMTFQAVSDVAAADLMGFARLWGGTPPQVSFNSSRGRDS